MQIQTFQSARAEQLEIAGFGENDFVHGLRLIHLKYGVANRASNDLAVRQLKLEILFAPLNPDCLQYRSADPRGLGARVDHQAPYSGRLGIHRIEDPATNVKKSHLFVMIPRGIRARGLGMVWRRERWINERVLSQAQYESPRGKSDRRAFYVQVLAQENHLASFRYSLPEHYASFSDWRIWLGIAGILLNVTSQRRTGCGSYLGRDCTAAFA